MMKRMLSLLLSLCLVAGLFAGMTTTASAEENTWVYTVVSGDTLSKICSKNGIDLNKNLEWIVNTNKLKSPDVLIVGQKLTLPKKGVVLKWEGSSSSTTPASTIAATTTTTTAGVGLLAGDTVAYYMFDYVVRSGDTLFKICQTYGANMDTVQKLNGIANAAVLRVGQKLSIPSSIVPGGTYTRIVSHTVVSGDTVAKICSSYGVSYTGATITKIKALNNRDNLDVIKVGQKILIPVPGSGAGGSSSAGSSAITNGATGAAYFTLNKTGSINGASAGQVVHVVATPDHGYKLNKITVVRDYNNTEITVDKNNNFTMPACDVRIVVTFTADPNAAPHSITKSSVSDPVTLTYVVNGYTDTKAEKGQTVAIVLGTLPSGYTLSKVFVTTEQPTSQQQLTKGQMDAKKIVSVASNLTFTMPASDVYVTVILKGA